MNLDNIIEYKLKSENAGIFEIEGGDLFDLCITEDIDLKQGEDKLVSLGIVVKAPKGYFFKLYPRSSTFRKTGLLLTNGVGIIDENYCGEDDIIKAHVYATRNVQVVVGTRLFQLELTKKLPQPTLMQVETMNSKNRGGYGSTD